MSGTAGFRVERLTVVPSERIYDVLADAAAWRQWAPLVSYSELIRRGASDPLGAGAIRRLGGLGVIRVDEQILEARAPHYQRYTAIRGIPVSHYLGEVHLSEVLGGTELIWTGTFTPRVPGTGRVIAFLLGRAIGAIAGRAIAEAERTMSGELR